MGHVFIIAAEPSGDKLGAHLMQQLKQKSLVPLRFSGIGGEYMKQEGLNTLLDIKQFSVMGFVEVLPHIKRILDSIDTLADVITSTYPDIVITIDAPSLAIRLVTKVQKLLRKDTVERQQEDLDIPKTPIFIHYVAPTVWAYKPKRAKHFAALFDHLLTLFPFEPSYFKVWNLTTDFVGHPLLAVENKDSARPLAKLASADTVQGVSGTENRSVHEVREDPKYRTTKQCATGVEFGKRSTAFLKKHYISKEAYILLMMPGSRSMELKRHLPIFTETLEYLKDKIAQEIVILIPTLPHLKTFIEEYTASWPFRVIVLTDSYEKETALCAATVALVKSGTSTLEVAAAGTPMVVVYKAHPISAFIAKRMIQIPTIALPNIIDWFIKGRPEIFEPIIPEYIQSQAKPEWIAQQIYMLLTDRNHALQQKEKLQQVLNYLKPNALDISAADIVLSYLSNKEIVND